MINCISFLNDMANIFFYVACSLNLYKWLVIINRVFKYAGAVSERWFNIQKKLNVGFYVFFTVAFGGLNLTFSINDMYQTRKSFYNTE